MTTSRTVRMGVRRAATLGILALLAGAPAEAGSTVASGVTNGLYTIQNPFDRNNQRKVVRDSTGACYVVFTQTTTDREVRIARSADCSTSWQQFLLFGSSTAGQEFKYPSIDISDDRKTLHVVAVATSPVGVLHSQNASLSGSGWSTADNWQQAGGVDPTPGTVDYDTIATAFAEAPSVAVDPEGRPHVVYVDLDGSSRPNVFYTYYGAGWSSPANLSQVTTGLTLPSELDPSVDIANSYVHVLYKDDSFPLDGSSRTSRYRYVRNVNPTNFTSFNAPVTLIDQGGTQNASPGSLAAYGRKVWVVGGYSSGAAFSWRNSSADDGATWADGATGAGFEASLQNHSPVVGLNPAGSDHRVVAMRVDGSQEVYRYRWNGTSWGSRTNDPTEGGNGGSDLFHVSLEKHKPAGANDIVYCWYTSGPSYDRISCGREANAMTQSPRTYFRSIGTAASYQNVGTITVTASSAIVTGSGTAWLTANRGRGDRLTVGSDNYVIFRVDSNTKLTLTAPAATTVTTGTYTIARQFGTLQEWENCISFTTTCPYFPVGSSSLVADGRSEIGIAYKDSVFKHSNGGPGGAALPAATPLLSIDGPGGNTDAEHTITLTADKGNRHFGVPGAGVVLDNETDVGFGNIFLFDDHVNFEWLEVKGGSGASAHGVVLGLPGPANQFNLRYNLIHNVGGNGVDGNSGGNLNLLLANSIIYTAGVNGVYLTPGLGWSPSAVIRILNNTVYDSSGYGIRAPVGSTNLLLANNVSMSHTSGAFAVADGLDADALPDLDPASRNNLSGGSSDVTAGPHSPAGGGQPGRALSEVLFVSVVGGNFHLQNSSVARDAGADLSGVLVARDIDDQVRPAGSGWDIGADEEGATTAVTLMSFEAVGSDGAVDLVWRTGSEVDNLGFHVYRSPSEEGPWTRLTSSLIPGQGFSATGASYSWRDSGLQNGTRYYYRLEDVDTKSVSTFHGPVSAVPGATTPPPPPAPPEGGGSGSGGGATSVSSCPAWALAQLGSSASYTCQTHGDPAASSFRVLSRTSRSALVELETAGFLTARDATGRVRALLPGFDSLTDPLAPALPLKRARLDGVVGRQARIGSIQARENRFFTGLVAAAVGYPQAVVARDGTVQPGRREAELGLSRGVFPRVQARLGGEGFQGEDKTLALELMPLRYDASRGALVLSRRLTVRVDFAGAEPSEIGRGRLGRRIRASRSDGSAYAFLATSQKGLHSVAFEALFPGRRRPLDLSTLRLTADPSSPGSVAAPRGDNVSGSVAAPRGDNVSGSVAAPRGDKSPVPFFVLPLGPSFGPGSRLFFYVDATASSTSFTAETVYALERGSGGVRMALGNATVDGSGGVSSRGFASFETNRLFAPDVLDIEDLWQWESLASGVSKTKPFALDGLDPSSSETARLVVYLQGGSDAVSVVDHHVQVFVNGALVAEESFDGAVPHRMEADVPVSLLAAANELRVTNVGDTGVSSRVFLDRFDAPLSPGGSRALRGLRRCLLLRRDGRGRRDRLPRRSPRPHRRRLLAHRLRGRAFAPLPRRERPPLPRRLTRSRPRAARLLPRDDSPPALHTEPGRLRPRRSPRPSSTPPSPSSSAGSPRASPPSPPPSRRSPPPSAAGSRPHRPSATSSPSPTTSGDVPRPATSSSSETPTTTPGASTPPPSRPPCPSSSRGPPTSGPPPTPLSPPSTATISSPTSPSDGFPPPRWSRPRRWSPRSSTGRPRARTSTETPPSSPTTPTSPATSRPTPATSRRSFLAGRDTTQVFLGQLPNRDVARAQILDAFNQGLSLISYVGHGGGAVWAGENILNSSDPASLLAQPRQPFMLTMNCLNGYFIAPFYESLAEGFLKAQGKGTIAAFSPSGLSLDGPAHLYHRAVMQEITSGQHQRIGDAILAAQKTYAQTGAFPELLSVYHLFGDPAMRIR